MRFHKIKTMMQLTSVIFTGIVVLQALAGQTLNNRILWQILVCAAAASLLKICFFQGILFEYSVWRQAAYLILVWLAGLVSNYLFGWGLRITSIVSILAGVLIIYFVIRIFSYQLIKADTKKMNETLKSAKKDEGGNTHGGI